VPDYRLQDASVRVQKPQESHKNHSQTGARANQKLNPNGAVDIRFSVYRLIQRNNTATEPADHLLAGFHLQPRATLNCAALPRKSRPTKTAIASPVTHRQVYKHVPLSKVYENGSNRFE
jgi:hypothetical protein